MKRTTLLLLAVACSFLFWSCQKEPADKNNTFKGPELKMGNGKARSFFTVSHAGIPQELGVEMTPSALTGLSQNHDDHAASPFVLPLHQKATNLTPFDHITINWEPHGHPPMGVFDRPHFDVHFYKISLQEQTSIPPYTPATAALFDNFPPAGYLPPSYVPFPGGVPQMGKHWVNANSPVLSGQAIFTSEMTYGTYNGRVTFLEPMVTMDFLQKVQRFSTAFPQPQQFSPSGTYYPTVYNVYRDQSTQKIYVSLSEFVRR